MHQDQQPLVKSTRLREAEEIAEKLKKDFKKDPSGTLTNLIIDELAHHIYEKQNTHKLSDLEKLAKMVQTLYNLRKDEPLSLPTDIEEQIIYLNEKRSNDGISSEKYRDLNFGIEQLISYTKLKEFNNYLDSNGIESIINEEDD